MNKIPSLIRQHPYITAAIVVAVFWWYKKKRAVAVAATSAPPSGPLIDAPGRSPNVFDDIYNGAILAFRR